jgi:crotonobetainyl-CoA:carnitine CoA-transferase CaiB-like acyl-CoA transferase
MQVDGGELMTGALEGIKVLDLSRLAPGPFCTMILGDLGADVLKVEGPREGRLDAALTRDERGNAFNALERNKRSIVLNLKTGEAREIFFQLAEGADVILEGFRPGVVNRLGVDYGTLKGINPRIVYCSLTGYGQDGPYARRVGHDINYLAIGGVLGLGGTPGGAPLLPGVPIGDFAAGGMNASLGILAALMARERTGRGQYVDIAMTDGAVSLLTFALAWYFENGRVPERGNDWMSGGAPFYNVYETKDGKYISIGSGEPWFYQELCKALGREDLIPFQYDEGEKRQEISRTFREIFRSRTLDEWLEYLGERDICVARVNEIDELAEDPQIRHRDMILELDHPEYGKVRHPGISIKLSETPGSVRRFGPLAGQHTDEVLLDLGYSKERIADLRKERVVG